MNKLASIPINKSDALPDTDEYEQDYESIKLISQEIIQEKEAIIQQIYKQLKDSIKTIDLLTSQLESYKKNQPQQISLPELQEKGFVRKQGQRYFFLVDVTKAIQSNKQSIKIDGDLQIINETFSEKLESKFRTLQSRYSRAMEQCDFFLKALSEKQQKEEILNHQIQTLKEAGKEKNSQINRLKEEIQMLCIENNQIKKQHQTQKSQLFNERQQLCLELSELKKFTNQSNERVQQICHQNEELCKKVTLLQQKIKGFELQKMEREYFEQDNNKSSIKYIDNQVQYPERDLYSFDKENQINLSNMQIQTEKPSQRFFLKPTQSFNERFDNPSQQKPIKQVLKVISLEQSSQSFPSSPQRLHNADDLKKCPDTFPEANTAQKFQDDGKQEIKGNCILPEVREIKKEKEKVREKGKHRKVIRINF